MLKLLTLALWSLVLSVAQAQTPAQNVLIDDKGQYSVANIEKPKPVPTGVQVAEDLYPNKEQMQQLMKTKDPVLLDSKTAATKWTSLVHLEYETVSPKQIVNQAGLIQVIEKRVTVGTGEKFNPVLLFLTGSFLLQVAFLIRVFTTQEISSNLQLCSAIFTFGALVCLSRLDYMQGRVAIIQIGLFFLHIGAIVECDSSKEKGRKWLAVPASLFAMLLAAIVALQVVQVI